MENNIFPLKKYKNYTYKQVLDKNDTKYFKYLINNFKFLFEDIYDFYVYLRDNNKLVNEIIVFLWSNLSVFSMRLAGI